MRRRRLTATLAAAGSAALLLPACGPSPWEATLVTTNAAGTDAANSASNDPVLSPDGTKLAFVSAASDLGATDTNGLQDVYVRDLATGTTTLVSVNADGTDAGDNMSISPLFSADSSKIGFTSAATDLVAGSDLDGTNFDAFVRDLATGTTTQVSVETGADTTTGSATFSTFGRADGSLVSFNSTDNDHVPNDPFRPDDNLDVFVRDLSAGTTTLVSVNAAGTAAGNRTSDGGTLSPDGTKVVFDSYADNLVGGDTNGPWTEDAFVRDLVTGTTTLVSVTAGGTSGNGQSGDPQFSPDGRLVAFASTATDLAAVSDTNGTWDAFVRNLATGTTRAVSTNAAGTATGSAEAFPGSFAPDGRSILFGGNGAGYGPIDTNGVADVYLKSLDTGAVTLVSDNADGTDSGNRSSLNASISSSGSVVFVSLADNLGPTDTRLCLRPPPRPGSPPTQGPCSDVYVRDAAGGTTLVSARDDRNDSAAGDSSEPVISADGRVVYFTTNAADLGSSDSNQTQDVYRATLTEPAGG